MRLTPCMAMRSAHARQTQQQASTPEWSHLYCMVKSSCPPAWTWAPLFVPIALPAVMLTRIFVTCDTLHYNIMHICCRSNHALLLNMILQFYLSDDKMIPTSFWHKYSKANGVSAATCIVDTVQIYFFLLIYYLIILTVYICILLGCK